MRQDVAKMGTNRRGQAPWATRGGENVEQHPLIQPEGEPQVTQGERPFLVCGEVQPLAHPKLLKSREGVHVVADVCRVVQQQQRRGSSHFRL
eukprot:CAMPEP_0195642544 /NCGR_PEP_ID=MMETSP0815-20121206/27340_1 /TAXON_ID=97485 /ORGANISM="Prymnesium parvum, Strain Texoma1" /LENGTH=91 /DNA_ID=CAMNT_0040785489 /DNA_START=88 /DNA_END=364 /DNA_ORIENTATION=+